MPVRLRLALIFAMGTAVVGVVFGYLFVSELSGGLRGSVVSALRARASTLLQQLPETGVPAAGFQLQDGAQGSGGEETLDLSQLIGRGGRVAAATGPASSRRVVTTGDLRRARAGPLLVDAQVGRDHTHFLLLVTPTSEQAGTFVVVGQPLTTVDQAISRVTTEVAVVGSIAVVAAALAAWFLASLALVPVERMRRQAEEQAERGVFTTLDVPRSRDEIAQLAETLNVLLGRLQDSLERERGFSAAAGHELRSPLALVRAELELAGRGSRSTEYVGGAVRRATEEVDRVIDLADRLLLLSRGDEGALALFRVDTDLRLVVEHAVQALAPALARAGIEVTVRPGDPSFAQVDATAYRRIVENLVENSARHGGAVTHIELVLSPTTDRVTLEVIDDGTGFPAELLPHAFERFSRADPSRSRASGGAGLGLSIVKTIAEAHGGTVAARNGPDGGAVVTVVVQRRTGSPDRAGPCAEAHAAPAPSPDGVTTGAGTPGDPSGPPRLSQPR